MKIRLAVYGDLTGLFDTDTMKGLSEERRKDLMVRFATEDIVELSPQEAGVFSRAMVELKHPGHADQKVHGRRRGTKLHAAFQLANLRFAGAAIQRAKDEAPEHSKVLVGLAKNLKGRMVGLKFKIKTNRDRIADKVHEKMREKHISAEKAKTEITDVLRYTMVFNKEAYDGGSGQVKTAMDKLAKDNNWTITKGTNYWAKGGGVEYKGINTVVKDKNGYSFELQFHTPESWEVKMRIHDAYSKQRKDPSAAEAKALGDWMRDQWKDVPIPQGIDQAPVKVREIARKKGVTMARVVKAAKDLPVTQYYALGDDEDEKSPEGIMKVDRDAKGSILDMQYWDWDEKGWVTSWGLMRYLNGNDLDFWDTTKEEAEKFLRSKGFEKTE